MGLSASPAIWQFYINAILHSIPDRSKYLTIMDGLMLHSSKQPFQISGRFVENID